MRICAGTTETTMGRVPVRPLLAPIDEESVPMKDGEGGEDESMQEHWKAGDSCSGKVRTSPRARKYRST